MGPTKNIDHTIIALNHNTTAIENCGLRNLPRMKIKRATTFSSIRAPTKLVENYSYSRNLTHGLNQVSASTRRAESEDSDTYSVHNEFTQYQLVDTSISQYQPAR